MRAVVTLTHNDIIRALTEYVGKHNRQLTPIEIVSIKTSNDSNAIKYTATIAFNMEESKLSSLPVYRGFEMTSPSTPTTESPKVCKIGEPCNE